MAKRRTKKQKIKAKARKVEVMVQPKAEVVENEIKEVNEVKETGESSEKKLIIKDLVKTGVISVVLLAILIGAYYYLKQN